MEELELGVGDKINVYKANMIIPQIAENLTRSGVKDIPKTCPVCGGETVIKNENGTKTLYCTNPKCQAKEIKSFALFVSRDALNMEGLSEATLEKFISMGFIKDFSDIFHIEDHKDVIVEMEGFGEKSYKKLVDSIEKARKTTLAKLVYGLGIAGIGLANAKVICKAFDEDPQKVAGATMEGLNAIDGIGDVLAGAFVKYFADADNKALFEKLLSEVEIKVEENNNPQIFAGVNFCVTGSVEHFANRNEVKAVIEARGGKVTGSVTSKTAYLINNDKMSASSKNKKALDLGIPIITEEEFIEMIGGEI